MSNTNNKQTKKAYMAPTVTVATFKMERGYSSSSMNIDAFQMDPFNDFETQPTGNEASHFGRTTFEW